MLLSGMSATPNATTTKVLIVARRRWLIPDFPRFASGKRLHRRIDSAIAYSRVVPARSTLSWAAVVSLPRYYCYFSKWLGPLVLFTYVNACIGHAAVPYSMFAPLFTRPMRASLNTPRTRLAAAQYSGLMEGQNHKECECNDKNRLACRDAPKLRNGMNND